jgi:hypothetical protein
MRAASASGRFFSVKTSHCVFLFESISKSDFFGQFCKPAASPVQYGILSYPDNSGNLPGHDLGICPAKAAHLQAG